MNAATILAAGRGTRFGSEEPKQFVEVLGKPILGYTLEVFQASPHIDAIQVVCQPEHRERVRRIACDCGIHKLRWVTPGGNTCPASIRSGFYALRDDLGDGDVVVLHVGVCPLVSLEDIAASISLCREKGCAFTMRPVRVCMAQGGGEGWADRDAPKEAYVELGTPWAFRYGDVYALYRQLDATGHELSESDYTLGLWLAAGRRAWYSRGGEAGRLKITTAWDRDLFEGCLRLRRGNRGGMPREGGRR